MMILFLVFNFLISSNNLLANNPKPKRDYSVLEKEREKFDSSGFLKEIPSIKETKFISGLICFNEDDSAGIVFDTFKDPMYLKTDDFIDVVISKEGCMPGYLYDVVDKKTSDIYEITSRIKIVSESEKDKDLCKAQIVKNYTGKIKKGLNLIKAIEDGGSFEISDTKIANIYKSYKSFYSEGDRVFIKFKEEIVLEPGTIIFFYEIKDPLTGKEIPPYEVADAKVVYSNKLCSTVNITSSKRSVRKNTLATTRL